MPEFPLREYRSRLGRLARLMEERGLDLLLVSGEENLRYFTGARSLVTWRSFTRPVFAVMDGKNPPTILTHASLANATRSECFYDEVAEYEEITSAPVAKLKAMLRRKARRGGRVGYEGGLEERIGLPFDDFAKLMKQFGASAFLDASSTIWDLRKRKSAAEIECIGAAGRALSTARQKTFSEVKSGMSEREVARRLSSLILDEGADEAAFVHVNSGSPHTWYPTDRKLKPKDLVYVDAGATVKGYTCEFDRLATVGSPSNRQRELYGLVLNINEAMGQLVKKGISCSDIFAECNARYAKAGLPTAEWGRAGHGQGLLATELPSVASHDHTVLGPGSVVSTEPGIIDRSGVYVWEDVYALSPSGNRILLSPEPKELARISG